MILGITALGVLIGAVALLGKDGTSRRAEPLKEQQFSAPIIFENTRTMSRIRSNSLAPLTVKTSGNSDYYLKLVDIFTQQIALTAYIKGGDMLTTRAPIGVFELRYAVGSTWYGPTLLFGPGTSYFKADDHFSFEVSDTGARGYTVELIKQAGGNLETRSILGSQF